MNIRKIGIAGAGLMGASMSQIFAKYGYDVIVYDAFENALEKGKALVKQNQNTQLLNGEASKDEVEKILSDSEEEVVCTLGGRHILFTIGTATLICRLLEGEFLDWRRVVPTNCPVKLCANVSDLAASIERVGLIVSEKYKSPVRCVFSNQVLNMRTNTTIGAAEDRCAIAGDGKELEIGFNVRYLADALKAIPSEEVTLELTNGLSPIVLTPVDDKHDFAYMVLPVRIAT